METNETNGENTNAKFSNAPELRRRLSILDAADHGAVDTIEKAIQGGEDINIQDDEGRTALLMGVRNGHVGVVQVLLQHSANVEVCTNHGATPLGLAAWRGFMEIMHLLMDANASLEASAIHKPAINWAVDAGQHDATEFLLKSKANPGGCPTGQHPSPLLVAADRGHLRAAQLLLDWGEQANGRLGGEALSVASGEGHLNVCELLLDKRADAGYADSGGVTALMWAASRGHETCVLWLIAAKATVDETTKDGRTPLMLAARRGHRDIVSRLLSSGASLYIPLQALEASGDVERLGSTIATGVSLLHGIPLDAFARKMSPRTAALIIGKGDDVAAQLLSGLFEYKEVIQEGDHPVNNVTLAYMAGDLNVEVDPVYMGSGKAWILPRTNTTFARQQPVQGCVPYQKLDVKFLRCVLPCVWDSSIVWALSAAPGTRVFEGPYAHALIQHVWKEVWFFHILVLCLEASAVLFLGWLAVLMSDDFLDDGEKIDLSLKPTGAKLGLPICWGCALPYAALALVRAWMHDKISLLTLLKFSARVVLILTLLWYLLSGSMSDARMFRGLASVVAAIEWLNFLDGLTALHLMGPAVLPILTAMRDIWVMALVLLLILLASIHAHVLLTRASIGDSYLIIWTLGLNGEFDLDEFSGSGADEWDANFSAPIVILLLTISFGVNLVLMNIFIGVVGNSYNAALETVKADFLRQRAFICVMHTYSPLWGFFCSTRTDGMLWVCTKKSYTFGG